MTNQVITSDHLKLKAYRSKAMEELLSYNYCVKGMKQCKDGKDGWLLSMVFDSFKKERLKLKNYC